ncbi:MAG TPA: hypothetical protein PKC24_02445 [Cyclobacteriaceae bacterium]|nr:hypothetical protein [Cyclobacteriaceae bacterium]
MADIGLAQRTRYRDVALALNEMSDDEALARLKEYMISDLDNPNANLRVALLHQSFYKKADPLTNYETMMAHASVARLRFTKVNVVLNEAEIKKNDELYVNIAAVIDGRGRRVADAPRILQMIKNGYDSADLLLNKMPSIYKNFTSSVDNYNRAIKLFSEICGAYASMSELYLLYDNELQSKMQLLKQNYDSTIYYFNEYQRLIREYPIQKYRQQYRVVPIVTYRLDGLITQMNFLENNLTFWNYGKWVDDQIAFMNSDIAKLRNDIEANEKKINQAISDAATKPMAGFEPISLDKQTMFNLKKFDYQSLVAALLEYKEYKQGVINKLQADAYFTENTSLEKERTFTYYSDIINTLRYSDSLLQIIRERNLEEKITKHKTFLDNYYAGKSGLEQYISTESTFGKNNFTLYVGRLRNELIEKLTAEQTELAPIRHRNLSIPLNPSHLHPDSLMAPAILTMQRQDNGDGSYYLAGVHRPDKSNNNLVAFTARINADGKLAWFKEFNYSEQQNIVDNIPAAMVSTREGCAIVMHVRNRSGNENVNKLIYMDEKGEEKFLRELEERNYPRKINYKEDNNTFLVVLKGLTVLQDITVNENLNLVGYNTLGDLLWRRTYEMAGTFEDLLNLQGGYMLAANYTIFKDTEGRVYRTRVNDGQTNALIMRLSERGDQRNLRTITSEKSFHIGSVYKVNDTCINLLGWTGKYGAQEESEPDVHIITDNALRVISSNL